MKILPALREITALKVAEVGSIRRALIEQFTAKINVGDALHLQQGGADFVLEGEAIQAKALITLKEKGVSIHRWSPEILASLEAAWNEVAAEQVAGDPTFKKVWDSYATFRAEYALWKELGYL